MSNKKEDKKETLHRVYCGPTLPRQYGLQQHAIIIGELPEHMAQAAAECPSIEQLMVPVAELAPVRLALKNPTSSESWHHNAIKQHFYK